MTNTLKISFELIAGPLYRTKVRRELENSKEKLKYWYPNCRVLLTEDKGLLETKFSFLFLLKSQSSYILLIVVMIQQSS